MATGDTSLKVMENSDQKGGKRGWGRNESTPVVTRNEPKRGRASAPMRKAQLES